MAYGNGMNTMKPTYNCNHNITAISTNIAISFNNTALCATSTMQRHNKKLRIRPAFTCSLAWVALLLACHTSPSNALSTHRAASVKTRIGGGSSRCNYDNYENGNANDLSTNRLFRQRSKIYSGRLSPSRTATCMSSSPMPHADLAVRLDQPVISPSQFSNTQKMFTKSILGVLLSDVFKTACVAFLIALTITFFAKSTQHAGNLFKPITSSVKHCYRLVMGKYKRIMDKFEQETPGVPMVFEGDAEDGWGVCTLSSVKPVGRSQYTEYEFKLPKADNILQLALGQQLTLCCLDSADNVAKRNYYVYSPKSTKGQFSVITAPYVPEEDVEMKKRRARGEGSFDQVLATELQIGDEIALQPGPRTLDYKGGYLPVTDMVYFASGDGIAPVIDQVKSVLPPGSSSVKGVSVIWTNAEEKDFDIALKNLEDEYFKYSTKLAVSCVVEDGSTLNNNIEVDESVPKFNPGTMAVVSGSREFAVKAIAVLMNKGYPENCICVLPSDE